MAARSGSGWGRLGRREFLRWSGGVVAGSVALRTGLGHTQEAGGPARPAPAVDLGTMAGLFAEIVRDLEKRHPYAAALYTDSEAFFVTAHTKERTVSPTPRRGGVVLRIHDGRSFHEAATGDLTAEGLKAAARALSGRARVKQEGFWPVEPGPARKGEWTSPGYEAREAIRVEAWVERASALLAAVQALDKRQESTTVSVGGRWSRTVFVDRNCDLRQSILRSGVWTAVFGADGEARGRASRSRRGQGGLEEATFEEAERAALEQEFDDTFRAERIPVGTYTVVGTPEIAGLLAHESFGHGVEYDMFVRGRARAASYLGKRVAPEWVQIWDDPSLARGNGSYFFDDEGWPAGPTQIVKDGVFVQPITDQYSAAVGRAPRTANGRRESYASKAYARMSNTFFGRGTTPVADLMASVDDGILLDGFDSGMEDPHGWGIQLICRIGYEIKKGKKTGRVFAPVGVSGYVPDILASITHVGDDFAIVPGTCGKGHKEWIQVADGGPHLVFRAPLG